MNKLKNIAFILMLTLIFLCCDRTYAAREDKINLNNGYICAGEQTYKIDKKLTGSKVRDVLSRITEQDLLGNTTLRLPEMCYCSANPSLCKDTTGKCKSDYVIKAEAQNIGCKIQNGAIGQDSYQYITCPVDEVDYSLADELQKAMEYVYDASIRKWKIKFSTSKVSADKINKVIIKSAAKNANGDFAVNSTSGEIEQTNGTYSAQDMINGIPWTPGESYYFVFYLNSGLCNGVRIGYVRGAVSSTVPNPAYNSQMCIDFRSRYANTTVEALLVPECYNEQIQASELTNIYTTIQNKINNVNGLEIGSATGTTNTLGYTCQFKNADDDTTTNVQSGAAVYKNFLENVGGSYWKALCTETLSLSYDDPKPVNAGAGFSYTTIITITRECQPYQVAVPIYYPKCKYTVECWGGPANHNGEAGAGPNDNFDDCISNCDGGKYTQDCINSCYRKVYGKESSRLSQRTNNSNISFLATTKQNNIVRLASDLDGYVYKGTAKNYGSENTKLPQSSSCVITSNTFTGCGVTCYEGSDGNRKCKSEHGVEFNYLNGCNANGTSAGTACYEVYTNYPCTEGDPEKEYKTQIIQASNEFEQVLTAIQEFSSDQTKDEKYSLGIDEKYTLKKNGGYLNNKTTYFTENVNPNKIDIQTEDKILNKTELGIMRTVSDTTVGNLDANFINQYVNKTAYRYTIERKITVNIGQAYVPKTTGEAVVYNQTNEKTDKTLDKNQKYYAGGLKYYTHLDSQPINNYYKWPYIYSYAHYTNEGGSRSGYTNNIHAKFNNLGSWNQWGSTESNNNVTVDCFYGLVNNFNACEDGEEPVCDENSICSCGIQYVYRTIDLKDVFPNDRNPRWNWTAGAKLSSEKSGLGYNIDPLALTNHIESKNESVYDVRSDSGEVDYEFVLTKENLANIRKYNKYVKDYNGDSYNNYLDYNMSCYVNSKGAEVCTSRFLDNIDGSSGSDASNNFISYNVAGFTIDSRRALAGCNNAYAGACFEIGS